MLVRENGHTSNPLGLVERLLAQFLRSGGELVHARAHGFRLDGRRLAAIQTDTGDLPADAAIVCTGAYSKPLAAALGDRVPLETERGYHLMISDPEIMPRIPTADADGKFVATPMDTGLRFAGTVELAGLAAPPDWRRARILLAQGRKMLPGLAASHPEERISVWMGHRPSLPDSLPVLGPSQRHAGRYLRLWSRACRDDRGADDRQNRRRPRRRPTARRSTSPHLLPAGSTERRRSLYPRSCPPVAFSTWAIRRCEKPSISASVKVRSCGCNTTVMASDFLPSGNPTPW